MAFAALKSSFSAITLGSSGFTQSEPDGNGLKKKCQLRNIHLLTPSLREPGGPCTKSMEVSESRMERVKESDVLNKHRCS